MSHCDRSTQGELFTLEICISLSDSDQNNQSELVRTLTASLLLRQICRIIFVCTKKYKVDQKEITKLGIYQHVLEQYKYLYKMYPTHDCKWDNII